MKRLRKTLAKACAFLMMINTIPVNVYAQDLPTNEEGNNTVIEETTPEKQPEELTGEAESLVEESGTVSTETEEQFTVTHYAAETVLVSLNSLVNPSNLPTTVKSAENEEEITIAAEDIQRLVIVYDPDQTLSQLNELVLSARKTGVNAIVYAVLTDNVRVVSYEICVIKQYMAEEFLRRSPEDLITSNDLPISVINIETGEEETLDGSRFTRFLQPFGDPEGTVELSEDQQFLRVIKTGETALCIAEYDNGECQLGFRVRTADYLYRSDYICLPVQSGLTKSNMPADGYFDCDSGDPATFDPSLIEAFYIDEDHGGDPDGILQISDDHTTITVQDYGEDAAVYAVLNDGNKVFFYIRAAIPAESFYVDPIIIVPYDAGKTKFNINCSPANATVSFTIIDNSTDEDEGWDPLWINETGNDDCPYTIWGYKPGIHEVICSYFDVNGEKQEETVEVYVVENLPYLNSEDYYWHYGLISLKENGIPEYVSCGKSKTGEENVFEDAHPLSLSVGESADVLPFFCYSKYLGNKEIPYYYPLGIHGEYHTDLTGVVAIDSSSHITAAKEGTATVLMSYPGDPPFEILYTVIVSAESEGQTGTETVDYSIAHLKNPPFYEETEYYGNPVERPSVYNCLVTESNTQYYELVIKRNTTGDKFVRNDAEIIAQMESLSYGDSFECLGKTLYNSRFEIYSHNTVETPEEGGGLSSETTIVFAAKVPETVAELDFDNDNNVDLKLNCVHAENITGAFASGGDGVSEELAKKVKSPEGSSFGLSTSDFLECIPDILDERTDLVSRVETSTECVVNGFDETSNKLSVDLKPKYAIYVEGNADPVNEGYVHFEGKTVYVSLDVSDLYEAGPVTIKHMTADGRTLEFDGRISSNGTLSFENSDGFSEFEIIEKKPAFGPHNLVLSGEIGLNFYVELPESSYSSYRQSYVDFTVSGKTTSVNFKSNNKITHNGKTYYKFTCYVNALQMAETVTAVYHYGKNNDKTITQTYSVKDYLDAHEQESFPDESVALAHAIADYGYHGQRYLADIHDLTIGTDGDYVEMDVVYSPEYTDTTYEAVRESTAQYELQKNDDNPDIARVQFSLNLESSTTMNIYFTPSVDYSGPITVSIGDKPVEPELVNGKYRVKIENIQGHKLGDVNEITVITENGTTEVTASPMSYVYGVLNKVDSSDLAKNCVVALYYYYKTNLDFINAKGAK